MPKPCGAEFRTVMDELFGDHGYDETAIGAGLGGDEGVKANASHGAQDGFDGAMRQRLLDAEQGVGRGQGFVLKQSSEGLDLMCWPMGEISQGALDDLVALSRALSQQNSGSRVSIGYGFDIHGNIILQVSRYLKRNKYIYMGTN